MKIFLKTISVTLPILALLIIFIPVQTIGEYIALNVAGIIMTIVAMILGIKYKDKLSIAIGIGVLVGLIIGLIETIFILNRYDLFL